ncbi:hypothetical protein AVEN_126238-1, partial [Araneus ventricosus]
MLCLLTPLIAFLMTSNAEIAEEIIRRFKVHPQWILEKEIQATKDHQNICLAESWSLNALPARVVLFISCQAEPTSIP